MQITRASDYAVRVMMHLAGLQPGSVVHQSELSKVTEVSGHFLSKVLQQLVRARLIRSQRGSGGGYVLAVPAAGVSLLEVVEAMEGPVRLNQCLAEDTSCERKSWCPAHAVWAEAQAAIVNVLGSASMASLADRAKANTNSAQDKAVRISGVTGKVSQSRA
jgi:Rrf2 family protein